MSVCPERERERAHREGEKLNKCETVLRKINYITVLCMLLHVATF